MISDLWISGGQFLDSSYEMKTEMVDKFMLKLNAATKLRDLKNIFDLYPVKAKAPIEYFYSFYL